ncbi:CRP/FNR family transcriptional regulator [Lactobacillus colini]|uniref:CRP/FNR family transcriptional regulator n=1 Tax=Lactobacillus colini TaxID=1819254 RepID=A0ABS4MCW8_9LACO|nr:Crp/Fnr family transcriptional regulator [Lactobacillus colini]MBP2057537.1 CRP/FNR family transcriptional regulator [Lactobacillus colini]
MTHSPINCLRQVYVFKDISDKTLSKLATVSTHRQHYKKGDFIVTPESQDGLIVIDQGQAKVYTLSDNGKEKILYIAEQGSINGQSNLFNSEQIPHFMQATSDSWVCSIKRNDFQNFLKSNPEIAVNLLNSIGSRLLSLEINNSRRDLMNSKDRIYSYLTDWHNEAKKDTFPLPIKKSEFASLLGISPETLSRQLKKLVTEGKIKMKGKMITLIE